MSAPVTTTKEAILAKLYEILNGTSTFFGKTDRQHLEQGNYEYPFVFINDIRELRTAFLKDYIMVKHTIMLIVWTYDDSNTMSTSLNSVTLAAIDAVKDDLTLGGLARNVLVLQVDTDEGFVRPHAVAVISLEVTYFTTH